MGASVASFACTQSRQRLHVLFPSDLPGLWVTATKCSAPTFLFFARRSHTLAQIHSQRTGWRRQIKGGVRRRWRQGHFFPSNPFSRHPHANKEVLSEHYLSLPPPAETLTSRGGGDRRKTTRIDRIPPSPQPTPPDTSSKVNRVGIKGTGADERGRRRHWRLDACRCVHEGSGCGLPNCCWLQLWSQASLPIPEVMWFLFDGAL